MNDKVFAAEEKRRMRILNLYFEDNRTPTKIHSITGIPKTVIYNTLKQAGIKLSWRERQKAKAAEES